MRESIMTGKTVEEATQLALAELGIAEEEATVEVLELPQRKLFRTIPAKVRVWVDEPEEKPQAPAPQPQAAQPEKEEPARPVKKPQAAPRVKEMPPVQPENRRRPLPRSRPLHSLFLWRATPAWKPRANTSKPWQRPCTQKRFHSRRKRPAKPPF